MAYAEKLCSKMDTDRAGFVLLVVFVHEGRGEGEGELRFGPQWCKRGRKTTMRRTTQKFGFGFAVRSNALKQRQRIANAVARVGS